MKTARAIRHLLLIEPDSIQAGLISLALQRPEIQISIAHNAQNAISVADRHCPYAVILELALPSHNGLEFLHEFRSYQEWSDVPVILFTQQYVEDESMFKSLGNVTYFYKPRTSLAVLRSDLDQLFS